MKVKEITIGLLFSEDIFSESLRQLRYVDCLWMLVIRIIHQLFKRHGAVTAFLIFIFSPVDMLNGKEAKINRAQRPPVTETY